MQFDHDAHRAAYERVAELMTQLFGEDAAADPEMPTFTLHRGSARIDVTVASVGEKPVVAVYSTVVAGVEPSLELYEHLLTHNAGSVFGAFGIADRDIIFQHTMVGETVDKEELRTSIGAVVATADGQDDEIVRRFGGTRARDLPPA